MTNQLHKENSPYLLQHANNPVHWQAWNEATLEKARQQNKPLLISIGYAACHWCHVMEKECFEDEEVARIMNKNFINIKIDREERPDLDHLYMSALQIMTGSGGWPLNVVALPDGQPFWGGTYLAREQWMSVLTQLGQLYEQEAEKVKEYAARLSEGISIINTVKPPGDTQLPQKADLEKAIDHWQPYMDKVYGGRKGAPKFMMPVNLDFLLSYAQITDNSTLGKYLQTTLTKMAWGGVYDHLGGGFARYATDEKWHIPHFEMMLYDNGQLLTTYALAYKKFKDPVYLEVIRGIHRFIQRELTGPHGEFYSSLDADSPDEQGVSEEGAFYTWTLPELKKVLGEEFDLFSKAYNINELGHWEKGRYVLLQTRTLDELAEDLNLQPETIGQRLEQCRNKLFAIRAQRARPALDDKCLTSWNAMTITGLVNAYLATAEKEYLDTAKRNFEFLTRVMLEGTAELYHNYRNNKKGVPGFLEDYAFLIDACISLYQAGGGEDPIFLARDLTNHTLDNFFDTESKMFRFTSQNSNQPVTHTIEKSDNVIPASNSVMAHNLMRLGLIFGNSAYLRIEQEMLLRMKEDLMGYGYSHANWLRLALYHNFTTYEIAITGHQALKNSLNLQRRFLPQVAVFAQSGKESNLPLLKGRFQKDKNLFYVCKNYACELPTEDLEACLKQINSTTK